MLLARTFWIPCRVRVMRFLLLGVRRVLLFLLACWSALRFRLRPVEGALPVGVPAAEPPVPPVPPVAVGAVGAVGVPTPLPGSGDARSELLLRLLSDVSEQGSSEDLSEMGDRMCSLALLYSLLVGPAVGPCSISGPAESSECEDSDEDPGRPSEEDDRSPSLVELRTDSSEPPDEDVAIDSVDENLGLRGPRGATSESGRSARPSPTSDDGLPLNSKMVLAREGRVRATGCSAADGSAGSTWSMDEAVDEEAVMARLVGRPARPGLPLISLTAPAPWGLEARCGADGVDRRDSIERVCPWNLVGSGAEEGAEGAALASSAGE